MPAPRGVFAVLVTLLVASATVAAALVPGPVAALADWPPSSGLVVAEVVTGGASASDEYVEIANAGSMMEDLGGLEVVYVTASGATTTRKAVFATSLPVAPGRHLLVANSAGVYGPSADATYTGGLSADGGVIVLRRGDATVIDAVGWGTAANAFVEGSAAPAPPAKSSIERLPGGSAGNSRDTNDNRADWVVQPNPIPQSLATAPISGPTATAPSDTAIATQTVTPGPTAEPTDPPATGAPTPTAVQTPTAETSPPPATATPTATEESPAPTPPTPPTPPPAPSPTATGVLLGDVPTASPSPTEPATDVISIAAARARPVGTRVHVAGVVTVGPGLVGADDLLAIRDSSGGIFVRLGTVAAELPIGRSVEVEGALSAPYGQLEIRELDALMAGADGAEPVPVRTEFDEIGEGTEAALIMVRGTVDSIQTDNGRVTITIGDGVGVVRALADPASGILRSDVTRGDVVIATGIVGQRNTATGRLDGYRLWLRRRADISVPPPIATDGPEPTPEPTSAAIHHDLASALALRGAAVDVDATVTATSGLLDISGPTIVVDDGTAAVAVVLPVSAAAPPVATRVHVTGKIGRWEGGPTVLASAVTAAGGSTALAPRALAGPLSASLEWRLVRVCGLVDRVTRAGTRWRMDLSVPGGMVAVLGEPAAGIAVTSSAVGRLALVTGIVRRSTSDPSVFQILPRFRPDLSLGPAPAAAGPAGTSTGSAEASAGALGPSPFATSSWRSGLSVAISSLLDHLGETVTIAGLVTETSSGTATINDGTGAVRIGGADPAEAVGMLEPGDAVEVTGLVRTDGQGLIVEADPASIVAMPGDLGDGAVAADVAGATAGTVAVTTSGPSASPATSNAAAASTRIAASPAALPDATTLLLCLLAAMAAIGAAVALASRFGRLRLRHLAESLRRQPRGPRQGE
jgi:hypothetical protein